MSWIHYLLLMRLLKKYVMGLSILTVEEGDDGMIGLILSRNSGPDASFSNGFFSTMEKAASWEPRKRQISRDIPKFGQSVRLRAFPLASVIAYASCSHGHLSTRHVPWRRFVVDERSQLRKFYLLRRISFITCSCLTDFPDQSLQIFSRPTRFYHKPA